MKLWAFMGETQEGPAESKGQGRLGNCLNYKTMCKVVRYHLRVYCGKKKMYTINSKAVSKIKQQRVIAN